MKKLLIALIVLVLILVAVLLYAAMNAGSLAEKYKGDLETAASEAVGKSVTLGKLDVSVFPSVRLGVDSFKVSETAEDRDGLTLKNLSFHLKLLPLLSGKLHIAKLSLDSPSITLISSKNGAYLKGLKPAEGNQPGKKRKAKKAKNRQENSPPGESTATAATNAISLELDEFSISNATLKYVDEVQGKTYDIRNLTVRSSLYFRKGTAVLADPRVEGQALDGSVPFGVSGKEIWVSLQSGELKLMNLVLSAAGNSVTLNGDLNRNTLAGNLDFGIQGDGYKNGALAIGNLAGSAKLSGPKQDKKLSVPELAFTINGAPVSVALEGTTNLTNPIRSAMESLAVKAFSGSLEGSASVQLGEHGNFEEGIRGSGFQMQELSTAFAPDKPVKLSGTISQLELATSGSLANPAESLKGNILFQLKDGELHGVNLAGKVLKAVTDLPLISGSLYDSVPEDQKESLNKDNTVIQSMSFSGSIANKTINTRSFELVSSLYTLKGVGTIGFDAKLSLNAQIIFTKSFSAALVGKTKELKALLNDQEQLVIPLALNGVPPGIVVLPDVKELMKLGAGKALQEKAGDLLGEVLGGKKKDGSKKGGGLGGLLGF